MCGIVGFTGRENALPILIKGLYSLEYRGYDSAGVAAFTKDGLRVVKARGRIANLEEKIKEEGGDMYCTCGIGHTRWATHGEPSDRNSHPHLGGKGKVAVVHNGIIENYKELRERLEAHGYEFKSETDTETVAHLVDYLHTGKQEDLAKTVLQAVQRLRGSYALGVVSMDNTQEIVAARRGNPLVIGIGEGENMIASDITAIINRTKRYIILDDNEVAIVRPDSVVVMNEFGDTVEKEIMTVTWDMSAAEKGGYQHFMLKEIMEQPRALKATIAPRIKNGKIVLDDFDEAFRADFRYINRIVITACGSAYHAGCVGRYMIESLCRVPVEVDVASELRYRHPIVDEHTLLIAVSQSGETADTIAAIRECKAHGARVLTIVNVVGSTVAKLGDYVMYTWAGPEIAVATTKGYTTQIAVLDLLAVWMANERRTLTAPRYAELVAGIADLPERTQRSIDLNPQVSYLAERYCGNSSLFFIGRNIDYAVALEASLKLKEISYIHSEAYAAGELKHGTIALIDPGRLVVSLACYEELFDKTMSNIKEVKARGAKVLAVVNEGNRRVFAEADDVLFVPVTDPLFSAIPEILPLQLFAYHVARCNGCDIDKPRNLAKSVTVE